MTVLVSSRYCVIWDLCSDFASSTVGDVVVIYLPGEALFHLDPNLICQFVSFPPVQSRMR